MYRTIGSLNNDDGDRKDNSFREMNLHFYFRKLPLSKFVQCLVPNEKTELPPSFAFSKLRRTWSFAALCCFSEDD